MNETQRTKLCKSLSYVLRHRPDSIGLKLDESGWAEVAMLPSALEQDGRIVTREQLDEVVAHLSRVGNG